MRGIPPQQVFRSYPAPDDTADPLAWPAGQQHCGCCGERLPGRNGANPDRRTCAGCGATTYRNPLPAIAVIVEDGDRFLLCRRKSRTIGDGAWCLPSGYVEFAEDFLSAARREVREETGLAIEVTGILSVVSNAFSPRLHSLVVVLLGRATAGELRANMHDIVDVGWYAFGQALPPLAFEADAHIIERYFSARFTPAPVDARFAAPPGEGAR